mgnify:CR=1 FL=1
MREEEGGEEGREERRDERDTSIREEEGRRGEER